MQNLAGNVDATKIFKNELERCGIPVFDIEVPTQGEVKAAVEGRLGSLIIGRAWRYFTVSGPVPLVVAERLYEHPVGRTDTRVAGHCACPPPAKWVTFIDHATGKEILPMSDRAEFERLNLLNTISKDYIFGDPADGDPFVMSYHIDSELALYLFAEEIKRSGLA